MLLLAVCAVVLFANPRHREFYFGGFGDGLLPSPSSLRLAADGRAGVPSPRTVGVVTGKVRVPTADRHGRVLVPVSDAAPWKLPADGVPIGWDIKQFAGEPSVELVRDEGRLAVRLRSDRASFALYRDVVVDLKRAPLLSWSWKAVKVPPAADVREPARDDQVAQVYVIFPRWPSPREQSDVIGYVWDSRAPVGTRVTNAKSDNVRVIVVESGPPGSPGWREQRRNVAEDYVALFGRPAPRVGKVAIMIDSDDTRADAEVLMGDLVFAPASSERAEIPMAVLR